MKKLSINWNIWQNVRFWILVFFFIRLIGITNPPLEVAHNWRQTTVTMVARNFLEIDNNIFYPRIDIAGNKTGITGMEFPVLNYIIYIFSLIFGYQHWYGRLINLIISSIGTFFFYKLIRKYFEEKIAFTSSIIFLCSLWFSYSRKIMPDTFSMSFILAAIYFGTNYLENKIPKLNIYNLFAYGTLVMVGVLSKLPSAYLLVLFIIPFLDKSISFKTKTIFALTSLVCLIPSIIWYFYWVPHLVKTFGFWHFFMGVSFNKGMHEIATNIPKTLQKFYEEAIKYVGFAAFLLGLFYTVRKKEKLLMWVFILSFGAFLVVIIKSGFNFPHHTYYILPFIPIMALVAGYGINQLNKKITLVILIAIGLEGLLNQIQDFRIHERYLAILHLENDLDKVSTKNDLIIINSGLYPTPMYFAHHKGWVDENDKIQDPQYIQTLQKEGLKYIVILKKVFGTDVNLDYTIVLNNDNYCIYKL